MDCRSSKKIGTQSQDIKQYSHGLNRQSRSFDSSQISQAQRPAGWMILMAQMDGIIYLTGHHQSRPCMCWRVLDLYGSLNLWITLDIIGLQWFLSPYRTSPCIKPLLLVAWAFFGRREARHLSPSFKVEDGSRRTSKNLEKEVQLRWQKSSVIDAWVEQDAWVEHFRAKSMQRSLHSAFLA